MFCSGENGQEPLASIEMGQLVNRLDHLRGLGKVGLSSIWANDAVTRYSATLNRGLLAMCFAILMKESGFGNTEDVRIKVLAAFFVSMTLLYFVIMDTYTSSRDYQLERLTPPSHQTQLPSDVMSGASGMDDSSSRNVEEPTAAEPSRVKGGTSLNPGENSDKDKHILQEEIVTQVDGSIVSNEAEARNVSALRQRVKDLASTCTERPLDLSDCTLVRFVRARKTLKESEEMFRNAAAFRQKVQPRNLLSDYQPTDIIKQFATGGWLGFDKDGAPVYLDRLGQLDVPGLVPITTEEDFVNHTTWQQEVHTEMMLKSESKTGKPVNTMVVIQDLAGLSWRHYNKTGLDRVAKAAKIGDCYYPERLKVALVVNAPTIFAMIWKVVKYFYHPNTREKIQIHSGPATKEILKYVSPSVLPKYLGGERVDENGDPECSAFIGKGGRVPAHLTK